MKADPAGSGGTISVGSNCAQRHRTSQLLAYCERNRRRHHAQPTRPRVQVSVGDSSDHGGGPSRSYACVHDFRANPSVAAGPLRRMLNYAVHIFPGGRNMAALRVTPFLLGLGETVGSQRPTSYRDEPTLDDLHPRAASAIEPSGDGTMLTEVKTETTDDN